MWVFITGITDGCSARDLKRLVSRQMGVKWSLWKRNHEGVSRSKILKIQYRNSRSWEYHGLVYIRSPDSVHSLIGRLNATFMKGGRLHAHPYIRRIATRDRRRLYLDSTADFPGNRRLSERRRDSSVSHLVDSVN
jgi:hypothetical protein